MYTISISEQLTFEKIEVIIRKNLKLELSDEAKEKQRQKAKGRFSLQWYIDRNGQDEGTKLYHERCENLSKRKMLRNEKGTFISSL